MTVFSAGPKESAEVLTTALAMGVDKAILGHIEARTDTELLPLQVAKMLRFVVQRDNYDLVFMGK